MQRMPNGPKGIETTIPITNPSNNEFKPMEAKITENTIQLYFERNKGDNRTKIFYFRCVKLILMLWKKIMEKALG